VDFAGWHPPVEEVDFRDTGVEGKRSGRSHDQVAAILECHSPASWLCAGSSPCLQLVVYVDAMNEALGIVG